MDPVIFYKNQYFKNYIHRFDEELNKDPFLKSMPEIRIPESEYNDLLKEAEALWGTTDWKGDWVPGLLRRELEIVYRDIA
jgi:hypothetical protein